MTELEGRPTPRVRPPLPRPRRPASPAAVALLLGVILSSLASAAGLAMRLDGFRLLGGLEDRTAVAADHRGPLSGLRPGFIQAVLGTVLPDPAPTAGPAAAGATAVVPGLPALRGPADAGPPLNTAPGAGQVVTHPFSNDNFENAYGVAALPFTGITDTSGETRQPGEPASCSAVGGTSWYRFTPARDMALHADTFGTTYADALAVFEGSSLGSLTADACTTSTNGNAELGFLARAGHVYDFQITGVVSGGTSVFHLVTVGSTAMLSGDPSEKIATFLPDVSGDGRLAVFDATTTEVDPTALGQPAGAPVPCPAQMQCTGIMLVDRRTGTTTPLATAAGTVQAPGTPGGCCSVGQPTISSDGRFVAFQSDDPRFSRGRTSSSLLEVYIVNTATRAIELGSVNSSGAPATPDPVQNATVAQNGGAGGAFGASLSADGRYLVFTSDGANLGGPIHGTPNDAGGGVVESVYVHDRLSGRTEDVAVTSGGEAFNRDSLSEYGHAISADGRFVAFLTKATNATPPCSDPNYCALYGGYDAAGDGFQQVVLRDRRSGTTQDISVTPAGARVDATSYPPAVSDDGSAVAFASDAANLVQGDTNGVTDTFVWTRSDGRIRRVSVSSSGAEQTNGQTNSASATYQPLHRTTISADGRLVAFDSLSADLVPNDTNTFADIFVHDLRTGSTVRASVSSTGDQANAGSGVPALSADGSVVVFNSKASTLAPGNPTAINQCFAHQIA